MSNPFSAKPNQARPAPEDTPPQPIVKKAPGAVAPERKPSPDSVVKMDSVIFSRIESPDPMPVEAPPERVAKHHVAEREGILQFDAPPVDPPIPSQPAPETSGIPETPKPESAGGDQGGAAEAVPETAMGDAEVNEVSVANLMTEVEEETLPSEGSTQNPLEKEIALKTEGETLSHHADAPAPPPPPLEMEEISCRTCRFFQYSAGNRSLASEGECRCRAPQQGNGTYATWPAVRWNSWCGEWVLGVSDEEMVRMARAVADRMVSGPIEAFTKEGTAGR